MLFATFRNCDEYKKPWKKKKEMQKEDKKEKKK